MTLIGSFTRRMLLTFLVLAAALSLVGWKRIVTATSNGNASAANQWQLLTQFKNVEVDSFQTTTHNGYLFTLTARRGIYRSGDGGTSWQPVNQGLPNLRPGSLTSVGSKLFACFDYGGIYVTTNNGENWERASGSPTSAKNVFTGGGSRLFASSLSGVFRSEDNGGSWIKVSGPLPSILRSNGSGCDADPLGSLAVNGQKVIAGTNCGIYISTDNGQSWRQPQQETAFSGVDRLIVSNGRILATSYNNGIQFSDDNGETWLSGDGLESPDGSGLVFTIGLLKLGGQLITTVWLGGVYVSNDNGEHWAAANVGLPNKLVARPYVFGNKLYLTVIGAGLYVSSDGGKNWSASNEMADLKITKLASVNGFNKQGTVLSGYTEGVGIYRSADEGRSWELVIPDVKTRDWKSAGNHLFRLDYSLYPFEPSEPFGNTSLWRSADFGRSWQQFDEGLVLRSIPADVGIAAKDVNVLEANGDKLFAGTTDMGVYLTTDFGLKWKRVSNGLTNQNVTALAVRGNTVFAGTKGGGVFVSTNDGQSWTAINSGLSNLTVNLLAAGPTHLYAATSGGVFVSANSGQNWTASGNGLSNQKINKLVVGNGNALLGTDDGVFLSTNNGQTWTALSDGLTNRKVTALFVDEMKLFAGTSDGQVFLYDLSAITATPVVSVSAATYAGDTLAGESIVTAFGSSLASGLQSASASPLPTSLMGTVVKVKDSLGAERSSPLFFVSPTQINYQIPAGTATGTASISVYKDNRMVALGNTKISNVAPGLFTADASGRGLASAVVLRVKANGQQTYEPIAQFDASQNKMVAVPIDLGTESDQVFLILYGTGLRFRNSLSGVSAKIGGTDITPLYAGAQSDFAGLDQVNLRLPRSLAGRGDVEIILTVDGKTANTVSARIK